ncbi:BON domain-containing protein [Cyclobacterium jeungdonense]|uniref:BON domain-containing protein n=1 Tax=Cyclobacterium jeungdonense TaxID=708087 RepID=A0ABT8CEJ9_9BACT|nr:BON domain-containing protein [Cyclobacterium jeungdonense]MDN3690150.1 BON domain-containing protein [Cyclobacterium jeungdonense]
MRSNDEIQKDVLAEIKWDPELKDVHTQIGVAVKDGVVTISGLVNTYRKKRAAEQAAQRVRGVKVVACDIEVKIGSFGKKSDTEIAEVIKDALRWNSAVNEDKIEVKVDNGWVFLDGEVEWNFQKTSAEDSIESLLGVRGITNNISIQKPEIDILDIKGKIAGAFHRAATIDSNSIKIETRGSSVQLSGKVRSMAEKKDAERIAWSSPGVLTVDNKITVNSEILA